MGDNEAWEEAWRCICKGMKKKKAAECSHLWMSEYYCKYCEPLEAKRRHAEKTKRMSQRHADSSGAKQKPGEAGECSRALDGITGKPNEISKSRGTIPQKFLHGGSVDDKFLAKAKFDGKEFRDGKTWNLGFPRGNFLPNLKVRLPKEWQPRDATGNPESRLTIAGRCPCCDNVIKREQKMIR